MFQGFGVQSFANAAPVAQQPQFGMMQQQQQQQSFLPQQQQQQQPPQFALPGAAMGFNGGNVATSPLMPAAGNFLAPQFSPVPSPQMGGAAAIGAGGKQPPRFEMYPSRVIFGDRYAGDFGGDSINALQFSPKEGVNILAASSWGLGGKGELKIIQYAHDSAGTVNQAAVTMQTQSETPFLCLSWLPNDQIIAGDAVGNLAIWDTHRPAAHQKHHEKGIRCIKIDATETVNTGGWDGVVRRWDMRTPRESCVAMPMPERVYSMDIFEQYLIVATAERHVRVFDLRNTQQAVLDCFSPLRMQSRSICFIPTIGQIRWAIGDVQGRVAVETAGDPSNSFIFRATSNVQHSQPPPPQQQQGWGQQRPAQQQQQDKKATFAVNQVVMHPKIPQCLMTASSDGRFAFWNVARSPNGDMMPAYTSIPFDERHPPNVYGGAGQVKFPTHRTCAAAAIAPSGLFCAIADSADGLGGEMDYLPSSIHVPRQNAVILHTILPEHLQ